MNQIDANRISYVLSESFGINLDVRCTSEMIDIRPTDLEYGEGFTIRIKFEWRTFSAEFVPDNFSASLIRTMGLSEFRKKEIFKALATKCFASFNDLTMKINGIIVNPMEPKIWVNDWSLLHIKLTKMPIIYEDLTTKECEDVIIDISGNLLGLILSLLPLEESVAEEGIVGLPEGEVTRVEVNRYERSPFNRQACITIHGCICKICDFNYENKYGTLGKGFIHVHHIVPLSQLGPDYRVNPEKDLIPVCANCHAMIHKRNPPYSVDELKSIISSNTTVGKGF